MGHSMHVGLRGQLSRPLCEFKLVRLDSRCFLLPNHLAGPKIILKMSSKVAKVMYAFPCNCRTKSWYPITVFLDIVWGSQNKELLSWRGDLSIIILKKKIEHCQTLFWLSVKEQFEKEAAFYFIASVLRSQV